MPELLAVVYSLIICWLALYGANGLWLTLTYFRHRHKRGVPTPSTQFPHVTVQIPLYNERHVATRVLHAVARLDWPRDRLHIQVLDDSDDATRALLDAQARALRARGWDIHVLRRAIRSGYKAGALAAAQERVQGEYVAIFDADFVPPPDFLKCTIPHLEADSDLGMVQARWGHLNAGYSALTRAQVLALDGHFGVEQRARAAAGYFFNFNGSGGVWRRRCIEESGGWRDRTLSEDLDLSYRAQLKGWRFRYLPDIVVPAEVPPQLQAFRRQQARWAQGSAQCLRLLARTVLGSRRSLTARLQALIHLSNYFVHPLMLMVLLLSLPLLASGAHPPAPLVYLSLASLGPPLVFAVAQRDLYSHSAIKVLTAEHWLRRYVFLPLLVLLGVGLSLNCGCAVLRGLWRNGGKFYRTPKFRVEQKGDRWAQSVYRLPVSPLLIGETLLAVYAFLCIVVAWRQAQVWAIPFLTLYGGGFSLMVGISLWQSLPAMASRRRLSVALSARATKRSVLIKYLFPNFPPG